MNEHYQPANRRSRVCCLLVLSAVFASLLTAACGGSDSDGFAGSPEDATRQLLEYYDKGQWGRAWDNLHPLHRDIIEREAFVACAADVRLNIDSVNVLETYDERVTILGTDVTVDSAAVTYELKMSIGLFTDETTETMHWIMVDDRWTWISADPESMVDCD